MILLIQAASCVLLAGVLLAGVMWVLPHLRRTRTMRRFRKQLRQAELVLMIWAQSVGVDERAREAEPEPEPEPRRPRRRYDNPA